MLLKLVKYNRYSVSIVTLITDFGTKDFYTGALKGAILSRCSSVNIVDISNSIEPFNITDAAFVLLNAYPSFPEGAIHLVSVNDLDERECRYIAIKHNGHYFLGLDNGIFSLVFNEPDEIFELNSFSENGSKSDIVINSIFAQAISQIDSGKGLAGLGIPIQSIHTRTNLIPVVQDSLIRGSVIYIDSFKNVILNVRKELFNEIGQQRNFSISFKRNERIESISASYHDVPKGEKLCLFNSNNFMEIAINSGKASSLLGLNIGDVVLIDFE